MANRFGTAALAACLALFATPAQPHAQPGDEASAARMATFERVWSTVNEKFYDPNFNGVDWKAVHDSYAPRVAALTSDAALYPLLNAMLAELKSSHFGVRPPPEDVRFDPVDSTPGSGENGDEPAAPAAPDPDDPSWGGTAGMRVSVVEGQPTITWVDPAGPAAKAGLHAGVAIESVGDTDLIELNAWALRSMPSQPRAVFQVRRAVAALLGGMPGTPVTVVVSEESGSTRAVKIQRQAESGRAVRFGEMGTVLADVQARRLSEDIGYLRFNIFYPQLMNDIRAKLDSIRDTRGIVLDLRDNPGGLGVMASAVASLFVRDATPLGSMRLRKGELRFRTFPQKTPYSGQLVILTDNGTASTSEILAGSLQEMGRAKVAGDRSLGAVLPSIIERLPNGAVFQYAVADFKTPGGVTLEGRGVIPDLPVAVTRADLAAGRDPQLEAAVAYLRSHTARAPGAR